MEEIELNGKKYVLKDDIQKKRSSKSFTLFQSKMAAKIHTALKKILREETDCMTEDEAVIYEKEWVVADPAGVMMVIPKTERAKILMRRYVPFDSDFRINVKSLELKYDGNEAATKFSIDYIAFAISIFSSMSADKENQTIKFFMRTDYPLSIENCDFKIIIAPRL